MATSRFTPLWLSDLYINFQIFLSRLSCFNVCDILHVYMHVLFLFLHQTQREKRRNLKDPWPHFWKCDSGRETRPITSRLRYIYFPRRCKLGPCLCRCEVTTAADVSFHLLSSTLTGSQSWPVSDSSSSRCGLCGKKRETKSQRPTEAQRSDRKVKIYLYMI